MYHKPGTCLETMRQGLRFNSGPSHGIANGIIALSLLFYRWYDVFSFLVSEISWRRTGSHVESKGDRAQDQDHAQTVNKSEAIYSRYT
jgi:hypothetical protein